MFILFYNINSLFPNHIAYFTVATGLFHQLFLPAMIITIGAATPQNQSNWVIDNLGTVIALGGIFIGAAATIVGAVIQRGGEKKAKPPKITMRSYNRHVNQYRQSIQKISRIAQVQVLGFSDPFNIENVYVQPRVYKSDEFQSKSEEEPFLNKRQKDMGKLKEDKEEKYDLAQENIEKDKEKLKEIKEWEPEMAIREFRRCVIVGEPGVGKTTLLKYLTLRSARGELVGPDLPDIPLYIELSNAITNESKEGLLDLLVNEWGRYAQVPADIARFELAQAIKGGRVLLLLDGLDETAVGNDSTQAREAYNRVLRLIQSFVDTYDKLYVVVTVRKATYYNHSWHHLRGFTELEIAKLTPDAITLVINNYLNASNPATSKQMIKSLTTVLRRNKRIAQLATNPLLLLLIVLVYRQNRVLPARKAELYERCIELLLRDWDAQKEYTTTNRARAFPPTSKNEDRLLAEIAWHLHVEGRSHFPRQKVLRIIADFLLMLNPTPNMTPETDAKEILALMVSTHNLIVEKSPGNYGFSHLTFQEYFAALYVRDNDVRDNALSNILLNNIDKSWWEEVLLLYASLVSDASPLLHKLLERSAKNNPAEELFHVSLLLAGRCLETATFLKEGDLRTTILDRLYSILDTTPYAYLQGEIADIMVSVGDIERLLNLLKRPGIEASLAKNITAAMAYSSDKRLLPELFNLLHNKEDIDFSYVRAHIALLIGKIGAQMPQNVGGRLLDLLKDSSNEEWYVRLRVADALGELGDPTIAPALAQMFLQPDDNYSIYYHLAITLGKLGNSAIIPALFDLLQQKDSHLNDYVQGGIVVALRMMANQQVINLFVRLLHKRELGISVRCQIAQAFRDIERTDMPIKDLLNILNDSSIDLEVREEIAATCCKLRAYSDRVIPTLLTYLSCKGPDRNTHSVGALRSLKTLEVPNSNIHIIDALNSWKYLQNATLLNPLYEQLKEPALEPDQRGNILVILASVDDRAHGIVQFVKDPSFLHICSKVQVNVIRALGYLGQRNSLRQKEIIEILLKLIGQKDLNPYVGRNIAEALNMLKMQNYVSSLLDLLCNHDAIDAYVRQGIAKIISRCELNDTEWQRLLQILEVTDIRDDVFEALMSCFHLRVP